MKNEPIAATVAHETSKFFFMLQWQEAPAACDSERQSKPAAYLMAVFVHYFHIQIKGSKKIFVLLCHLSFTILNQQVFFSV